MAIKGWTDFVLLAVYISFIRPRASYSGWWRFWNGLRGTRVKQGLWEYLILALPGVAMTAAEWWAFELLGLCAGYLHSASKLAAHVTAANISSMLYLTGTGAQKAASTLVGASVGRGAGSEAHMIVNLALSFNCCCSVVMGLLVLVLARPVARAYVPGNLAVQDLLVTLLPILSLQGLVDGANQCLQGALYGFGLQGSSSKISLCCYWLVLPPVALTLCFPAKFGVAGLWLAAVVASLVALAFNFRLYRGVDYSAVSDAARSRMELDGGVRHSRNDLASNQPLQNPLSGDDTMSCSLNTA